MAYPIRIGITALGVPIIGAKEVKDHGCIAWETVYGSQIGHRCAALVNGEWRLLTPTDAKFFGATKIHHFPMAKERH